MAMCKGNNLRQEIISVFEQVAREQNKTLAPLTDELILIDSGLDSLCFAIIIVRLEDSLGFDPFDSAEVAFPIRFGELVLLFQKAESVAS
jgi:acyl carrier protein